MKFLLDNNLPPAIARALHALSAGEGHWVWALKERFPADTSDVVWLGALAKEKDWAVVTGDTRISRRAQEREAWLEAGVTVFFLKRGWSSLRYWDKAAKLVAWWPTLLQTAENIVAGAGYFVPVKGKRLELAK